MKSNNAHQRPRWFRSAPIVPGFSPDNIDAEAGILRDVVMVEEGPAKGHGVNLEAEFITGIVRYDRTHFSNIGVKARFGHPSASSETMGTQMGVFRNFRKRDKDGKMQAIADLHLLAAADESPTHPGMRSWVLKMAEERPDFIMSSIVFEGSGEYQRKPNGNKHRLEYNTDMWEGGVYSNYNPDWGDVYVEFDEDLGAAHYYTDLVEAGAATDTLFGTKANPHLFVSKAHQFLDENPDVLQFVQSNPERMQAFLQRLGISLPPQQKKMAKNTTLFGWLLNKEEKPDTVTPEELDGLKTQLSEARTAHIALQADRDQLDTRVTALQAQVDTLQASVTTLKAEAETLRTDLAAKTAEVEALKKEPADTRTAGDSQEPAAGGKKDRAYNTDAATVRARKISSTKA